MARRAAFVYDDVLAKHALSETHPLKPVRLRYTYELLDEYGAFESPDALLVAPRMATEEEVLRFHTPAYLGGVQALSDGEGVADPEAFNFGPGDNPTYEGMYEAVLWSTGASVKGAELIASGEVDAAFSISGVAAPRDAGLRVRLLRLQRSRHCNRRAPPAWHARGVRGHRLPSRRRGPACLLRQRPGG